MRCATKFLKLGPWFGTKSLDIKYSKLAEHKTTMHLILLLSLFRNHHRFNGKEDYDGVAPPEHCPL
jgi:hypothetical protein